MNAYLLVHGCRPCGSTCRPKAVFLTEDQTLCVEFWCPRCHVKVRCVYSLGYIGEAFASLLEGKLLEAGSSVLSLTDRDVQLLHEIGIATEEKVRKAGE